MSDDLISRATDLREKFLDWASLIDELIQSADCIPDLSPSQVPDPVHAPAPSPHPQPRGGPIQDTRQDGGVTLGAMTEAAALSVLRKHEPASTREIYAAIRRQVPISGKNPLSTLSSRLSISRRIRRGPDGWVRASRETTP